MKILLAEDEEGIAVYIRTIMEKYAEIQHVKTLNDCMDAVKKNPFDVVLLDLKLDDSPALLTIEEIKNIKALQPKAALIVNTGMGESYGKRAIEEGADFVLSKEPETMERKAFCAALYATLKKKNSLADNMDMLKKIAEA